MLFCTWLVEYLHHPGDHLPPYRQPMVDPQRLRLVSLLLPPGRLMKCYSMLLSHWWQSAVNVWVWFKRKLSYSCSYPLLLHLSFLCGQHDATRPYTSFIVWAYCFHLQTCSWWAHWHFTDIRQYEHMCSSFGWLFWSEQPPLSLGHTGFGARLHHDVISQDLLHAFSAVLYWVGPWALMYRWPGANQGSAKLQFGFCVIPLYLQMLHLLEPHSMISSHWLPDIELGIGYELLQAMSYEWPDGLHLLLQHG